MATEFEKIDNACIGKKFYDRLEEINYTRFVKGMDYVRPIFNNDNAVPDKVEDKNDMKKGDLGLK